MPQQFADYEAAFMKRAIALARRGQGRVEPNPMVGCVLARGSRIIAEGYHRRFGGPHAEVNALRRAADKAAGATAYVTLEPCCHTGKTPPCTDALIEAGVARVVVAMKDPFPEVAGRGIRQLRRAGIRVDVGLCREEAAELNAPYLTLVGQGRPYVIAKWAQSIDGKIATHTGDSKWISGPESRRLAHRLRARVDGIMVGIGTVLADDPLLTARDVPIRRTATRIILDTHLRLPLTCQLVKTSGWHGPAKQARELSAPGWHGPAQQGRGLLEEGVPHPLQGESAPLLILTSRQALRARKRHADRLRDRGVEIIPCRAKRDRIDLNAALRLLGDRQMTNLLVEGGGQVLAAFLDARLADEAYIFIAPKLIGGQSATQAYPGQGAPRLADTRALHTIETRRLGPDTFIRLRFRRS